MLPDPRESNSFLLSEYFLVQAFSKQASVVLGKISDVFIPDQTAFGDAFKYYFANFNFKQESHHHEFLQSDRARRARSLGVQPKFVVAVAYWIPIRKRQVSPNPTPSKRSMSI